jgi:hypothetical protein
LPLVTWAGDDSEAPVKHENPKKVLNSVVSKLNKTKGYEVKLDVSGGISQSKNHEISELTVRESYEAKLVRDLMHVPSKGAYRTPEKGAIGAGGDYQQILATPDGARLDRLFRFPKEILAEAAASGMSFEWLDGGMVETTTDDEEEGDARTKVTQKKYVAPTRMRVEVPEQVAITRFVTIENSGCMSGG